jgi:hypothetical protein
VFLSRLFAHDPDAFTALSRRQALDLKRPRLTLEQLIERLERVVPSLAAAARAHSGG